MSSTATTDRIVEVVLIQGTTHQTVARYRFAAGLHASVAASAINRAYDAGEFGDSTVLARMDSPRDDSDGDAVKDSIVRDTKARVAAVVSG